MTCDICEVESPSCFKESTPVARKTHVCCECGSTIQIGEKYHHLSGLWGNSEGFQTFKTCVFCREVGIQARSDFYLDTWEPFPIGSLWDCVGYDYKLREVR